MDRFNYIFSLFFLLAGVISLLFSRSKRNYEKLIDNHGQDYANKVNKVLTIGGYGLLICGILLLLSH